MMTNKEIITVSELIVKMEESEDHTDVVVAFTDYLKGLNPHQITSDSLMDLEKVISDHLDSMNHWEKESDPEETVLTVLEKDCMDEEEMKNFLKDNLTPSIYSL